MGGSGSGGSFGGSLSLADKAGFVVVGWIKRYGLTHTI